MKAVTVKVKLENGARIPRYATSGSAGLDLTANETIIIPPKSWRAISTGVFFEVPEGYELQIRSRSGLASKGVNVINQPGTIDSDYRGEIKAILHNHNTKAWQITRGDRIAQAVLSDAPRAELVVVSELSETARGEKGFGSTGR